MDASAVKEKVKPPAIGLIVLGVLGALAAAYGLVLGKIDAQSLVEAGIPEEQAARIAELAATGGVALHLIDLVAAGFVLWAGLQMLKLRAWTACVVANVLVMIPCVTSCCCLLGVPVGVWGLIVLCSENGKRAFRPPDDPSSAGAA